MSGRRPGDRGQPEPSTASDAVPPPAAIQEHLDLTGRHGALATPIDFRTQADAAPSHGANPPRFVFGEIVRLARATGTESDARGRPFDARVLVGKEFAVLGASPSDDGEEWRIHLRVERSGSVMECPEGALEPTGLIEVVSEDGSCDTVPIDPSRHRGWRDDLMLEVTSAVHSRSEAAALAEEIAIVVSDLVRTDAVEWQVDEPDVVPYPITLWVWPVGDALKAFEQLVESADEGWHDDEDESIFISSRWERGGCDRVFLTPAVRSAELTYRRWSTPRRRRRRDPLGPSESVSS
jgi:hypothetical protein